MRTLKMAGDTEFAGMNLALADDDVMYDGRDDHYLNVGLSAAHVIRQALQGAPAPRTILDLPCGHGRVTRVLKAMYPSAGMTVCDIDHAGVNFAADHFKARGVYSQKDFRDLDLGATYDLIWVGSLITHLSERDTRRFFDFAARHLSPDGTLVITSHGAFVAERLLAYNYGLTDEAARGLLADSWYNGYGYRCYPGGEGYGISLVRPTWYQDLFAAGPLQLDRYEPQRWDAHQDVLVVRPRAPYSVQRENRRSWLRLGGQKNMQPRQDFYATNAASPPDEARQAEIDRESVTGFDEAWYLAADPLVAAAVAAGSFRSGFDHYCIYGWREARPICDPHFCYDTRTRER